MPTENGIPMTVFRRNMDFRKIYGIPEVNSGGFPDKKMPDDKRQT